MATYQISTSISSPEREQRFADRLIQFLGAYRRAGIVTAIQIGPAVQPDPINEPASLEE